VDAGDDEPAVDLEDFLGLRAHQIVLAIPEASLRMRVLTAIQTCADTLEALDAVDLSPHELAALETPNVAAWNALAPDVRNILVTVRGTCDQLVALFPSTGPSIADTSELAPDIFAETSGAHVQRGRLIDDIVQGSSKTAESLGEGITTLVEVLKKDIVGFGNKLRNPQIVGDRWFLLGEVHQFLGQCAQCLEAIVASMLSGVSSELLSDMLPRYLDATMREIMLRGAITDLLGDINQFNDAIARAPRDELSILVDGLVDRLTELARTAAYKLLKPQDKRAIIMVRIFFNSWETKSDVKTVRNEVEGFAKFLALMRDLNWRENLIDHDRRALLKIQKMLASGAPLDEIVPQLRQLYGAYDPLDDRIRAVRIGIRPSPDELRRLIFEAQSRFSGR
jgi:hypothetical protein